MVLIAPAHRKAQQTATQEIAGEEKLKPGVEQRTRVQPHEDTYALQFLRELRLGSAESRHTLPGESYFGTYAGSCGAIPLGRTTDNAHTPYHRAHHVPRDALALPSQVPPESGGDVASSEALDQEVGKAVPS